MTRTITLVALALAWIAVDCSAAPPEGKRGKGAREGAERVQQRGGDPAQMVARMIKEFDKDGDQKLDAQELTALMASMRERRGGRASGVGPGQPAGKGAGKNRQRPGGEGRGKRGADKTNTSGGAKPKRPEAQ